MGKTTFFLVLFLFSAALAAPAENIHQQTARCREAYSQGCEGACALCHPSGEEAGLHQAWNPRGISLSFFSEEEEAVDEGGDIPLCLGCHDEKGAAGHPVGVLYPRARRDYVDWPSGPLLFCDSRGENCRVYCSSCHDPHVWDEGGLLRTSNQGSNLCLACHLK